MDKEKFNESKRFLAEAALIIILAFVVAFSLGRSVYRPSLEEVKTFVSQEEIKSDMDFSSYHIGKEEPVFYLAQQKDLSGQIFYISRSYLSIVNLTVLSLISIMGLYILIYLSTKAYQNRLKNRTMAPVVQLSNTIRDILSGTSREEDLEKLVDELRPIIDRGEMSETELEKSIEMLFQAEKNRREFTANVSHELKTPLTSINGYAELIASGLTSEEDTKKFAAIILNQGNKLLQMIEEIIKLSKYESEDRSKMQIERVDLGSEAEQICQSLESYAQTKDINLSCQTYELMISADKSMVQELIRNLVSNAIKYNKPGGYVKVEVTNEYPYAKLVVRDNGIGISKEDQERVFERFYMVSRSSSKTSGTGLGLSLVKHIVESHGGEIYLESELGKGSCFTVKLPMLDKERMERVLDELHGEGEEFLNLK